MNELTEAPGEIRTALLLDERGVALAHAGDGDPETLVALSGELLAAGRVAGARSGGEPVGGIEVSGPAGGVFASREAAEDGGRTLLAVTGGGTLSSLVLYDLRMSLGRLVPA